jgi:hypothetical protein
MSYLILIIISFFFAGILYLIAEKRGADKIFWTIMGLFFGPFAMPFVFFAKRIEAQDLD